MYDILSSFWLLGAEVVGGVVRVVGVVGGGESVKSIDGDIGGGADDDDDDDELGNKCVMGLEEWTLDLEMSFLLGGIVKEVVNRRMWKVSALLLLHL